jgi:flagellar hook-basal body complex protein FliE
VSIGKVYNPNAFQQINRLDLGNKEVGLTGETRAPNSFEQFGDLVAEGIDKVNTSLTDYEKLSKDFSQGERVNVHELMVKGEQADMSLKLMLSLKNKVVEAYQEVMRLPV